jgi:hypothetical protein
VAQTNKHKWRNLFKQQSPCHSGKWARMSSRLDDEKAIGFAQSNKDHIFSSIASHRPAKSQTSLPRTSSKEWRSSMCSAYGLAKKESYERTVKFSPTISKKCMRVRQWDLRRSHDKVCNNLIIDDLRKPEQILISRETRNETPLPSLESISNWQTSSWKGGNPSDQERRRSEITQGPSK